MALLDILHYPDPRLHLRASPVAQIDDKIKQFVADMAETMYANKGIGLAATQVNVPLRILIMDISGEDEPRALRVFINPEILTRSGEVAGQEGCLSVPGVYEEVLRAETIELKYLDLDAKEHIVQCDGLFSVCAQHEIDHLDGRVFVDYLSNLKQTFIKKKMKKIFKPV